LALYFFHERSWARIRWGIIPGSHEVRVVDN